MHVGNRLHRRRRLRCLLIAHDLIKVAARRNVMGERRHPQVVNVDEVEAKELTKGTRFGAKMRSLGMATGARGLGCTLYEVAPGRTAFPRHAHMANEEAAYVLEGEGTLRLGDASVPVRAGDYITKLAGPDHAHQLVNTGSVPLRYLCLSTKITTEIVTYPDSKKVGVMAVTTPGQPPAFRAVFKQDAQVDYYEGEDAGE
jgi:uncharacterized cupin superfamily protein